MNRSYTLKLGICYIVQKMMVNSEQIRFHQKGRVEIKEKTSEPSARSYMPGKESSGWRCYFESGSTLASERE